LPERLAGAPRLLTDATLRWLLAAKALAETSDQLFTFHERAAAARRKKQQAAATATPPPPPQSQSEEK
jgi:hypothetical protein